MTDEDRAKAIVNAVNADYADETFVSEGYCYFDDMTAAIAQALRETAEQARREALEEAAQMLEQDYRAIDSETVSYPKLIKWFRKKIALAARDKGGTDG